MLPSFFIIVTVTPCKPRIIVNLVVAYHVCLSHAPPSTSSLQRMDADVTPESGHGHGSRHVRRSQCSFCSRNRSSRRGFVLPDGQWRSGDAGGEWWDACDGRADAGDADPDL
jgi:hypothetical protein